MSQAEFADLEAQLAPALSALLPIETLLAVASRDEPISREATEELRNLGIPLVAVPEPDGLELDLRARARVAMLLGRHLVPLPLVLEAFLLGPALAHTRRELVAGGGGFKVGERAYLWLQSGAAVAAVDVGDEVWILDVAHSPTAPVHGVDAGQGLVAVKLRDAQVAVELRGDEADAILRGHRVAWLAHAVGVVDGALAISCDYARERQQFGRPIASFQAVAHKLAGIKVVVDSGRAAIARLAALIEAGQLDEADRLEAAFSHSLPEAARRAIEDAIQVHGGMGFTWEYGLHLRYRRVLQIQAALGGSIGSAKVAGERYLQQRAARLNQRIASS